AVCISPTRSSLSTLSLHDALPIFAEALARLGDVTVVAPERDRSGASNSLTLDRPLVVRRAPNGYFSVNGTPTDCVHIAVTGLLRSEEHTSELQSPDHLVCRLLLEK